MKEISIYDSTLRDGMQGETISFTVADKLKIVTALDRLGVAYIEAGNPGSNPKDMEFFHQVHQLKLENAKFVAFGSTRRKNTPIAEDKNVAALLEAGTEAVAIFGKSWDIHVTDIIKTTLEENLRMIEETVAYFVAQEKELIFDAEHFFDGYKANKDYALASLEAAVSGGAHLLCLCDTNGGCTPGEIGEIVAVVKDRFPVPIGIHCHNDMGCAVANSLVAVENGATQVQGTYIGFGERCGNTNLSTIIGDLQLKMGYHCIPSENLHRLTKTAIQIADITNLALDNTMPYVGRSAFAHKGGMHIDGILKRTSSFEHIDPQQVGNKRNFLLSEVSGKNAILTKLADIDPGLTKEAPETEELVQILKELEYEGYQFEAAMASFQLIVLKHLKRFHSYFQLERFKIVGEQQGAGRSDPSFAMVKIRVGDRSEITAEEGDGPVHALDKALRKAIELFYPEMGSMRLIDYKVRVIDPSKATATNVRVLIESSDGDSVWSTVGVSTDIINASLRALVDSIEYKLMKDHGAI